MAHWTRYPFVQHPVSLKTNSSWSEDQMFLPSSHHTATVSQHYHKCITTSMMITFTQLWRWRLPDFCYNDHCWPKPFGGSFGTTGLRSSGLLFFWDNRLSDKWAFTSMRHFSDYWRCGITDSQNNGQSQQQSRVTFPLLVVSRTENYMYF